MRLNGAIGVCIVAGVMSSAPLAGAGSYSWSGYTFEQDYTPDVLGLPTGAPFTTGQVTRITQSVGFVTTPGDVPPFQGLPGFDPALSLGRQGNAQQGLTQSDGSSSHYASAINMPNGNNGTQTRHGLEVSWSGGRLLTNGVGDDFGIYESGSSSTADEGFMVRARRSTGSYTDWYYQPFDGFQLYTNSAREGAFVHQFDLSDMGVAADELVEALQIANLTNSDTLASNSGGTTLVLVNDLTGFAHGFGSGELDPDPLYVGVNSLVISQVAPVPSPTAAAAGVMALLGLAIRRRGRA